MSDHRAALEAAIEADPDDPSGYEVLADYLQEIGDPRGELISVQLRDASGVAFERVLAAHHSTLQPTQSGCTVTWRYGYVHDARVAASATPGALRDLLEHPAARFLAGLALDSSPAFQHRIDVLAEQRRPTLRRLNLGHDQHSVGMFHELGTLAALWPKMPNLVELQLGGRRLVLGEIALPALEHLGLAVAQLSRDVAHALARATWPKLTRLAITLNTTGRDVLDDLCTLLDRTPVLAQLSLRGCGFADALVRELVALPVCARLTALDLAGGQLTDVGAQVIARHAQLFRDLVLDVHENRLTPEGVALLEGVPRELIAGTQRPPDPEDEELYDY